MKDFNEICEIAKDYDLEAGIAALTTLSEAIHNEEMVQIDPDKILNVSGFIETICEKSAVQHFLDELNDLFDHAEDEEIEFSDEEEEYSNLTTDKRFLNLCCTTPSSKDDFFNMLTTTLNDFSVPYLILDANRHPEIDENSRIVIVDDTGDIPLGEETWDTIFSKWEQLDAVISFLPESDKEEFFCRHYPGVYSRHIDRIQIQNLFSLQEHRKILQHGNIPYTTYDFCVVFPVEMEKRVGESFYHAVDMLLSVLEVKTFVSFETEDNAWAYTCAGICEDCACSEEQCPKILVSSAPADVEPIVKTEESAISVPAGDYAVQNDSDA